MIHEQYMHVYLTSLNKELFLTSFTLFVVHLKAHSLWSYVRYYSKWHSLVWYIDVRCMILSTRWTCN